MACKFWKIQTHLDAIGQSVGKEMKSLPKSANTDLHITNCDITKKWNIANETVLNRFRDTTYVKRFTVWVPHKSIFVNNLIDRIRESLLIRDKIDAGFNSINKINFQ